MVIRTPCALGDVEEVRSLVSQHSNLSIVLALDPVIALALSSLLVLGLEQKVCHQAAAEQEEGQVCQHNSMAKVVFWLILSSVDVRADHALKVSPADDDADCDTSLVSSFDVVGAPCNTVTDETTIQDR